MAANSTNSDRTAPPPDDPPVGDVSPSLPETVSVTLWLRGSAPSVARERQDRIAARVEAFDRYRAVAGDHAAIEDGLDAVETGAAENIR